MLFECSIEVDVFIAWLLRIYVVFGANQWVPLVTHFSLSTCCSSYQQKYVHSVNFLLTVLKASIRIHLNMQPCFNINASINCSHLTSVHLAWCQRILPGGSTETPYLIRNANTWHIFVVIWDFAREMKVDVCFEHDHQCVHTNIQLNCISVDF